MCEFEEVNAQDAIFSVTNTDVILGEKTSMQLSALIEKNKGLQKELIRQKKAFNIKEPLLFNNSKIKGKVRQSRLAVFLLKAFNSEVDNLISQTKVSSFPKTIKKVK